MAALLAWSGIDLNLPENSDSQQQRDILDALPVLVFLERAGLIVFANAEARHEIGHEGEWVQRPVEDVLWGLFPGTAEPRTSLTGSKRGSPFHATLACTGGRMTPVEGTYSILNPEMREAVIVAQAAGRERTPKPGLMEDVLSSLPEAVAIVHGSHVLYTNPAFTAMFGYSAEEVSGGDLRDLLVPETRLHEHAMLQKLVDDQGRAAAETVRLNRDGELVDVALKMAPLKVSGDKAGYVLTFRDIGERKEVEAKLQHDAMHDVLTGLPNRALFTDRLKLALNRLERRRDQTCAVFFMDVDRFKMINDTLGHAAGDLLLVAMANRLTAVIRPQDTAARLGGDEFAVLVENIHSATDLDAMAQRLVAELDQPFEITGRCIQMRASIGIAMAGDDHPSAEQLIQDADAAMYRAKQEGGHRYMVFDRHMEVHASILQEKERELRDMVSRHDFSLWYQPIYRLATGRLEGFESLLRWRTAGGSVASFRELLPVAEDTGLSISIGRDTIQAACTQLLNWDEAIPGNGLILSVNLTRRQFYQEDLVAQLRRTLAATRVDPARLMFEVSEDTLNENPDRALVHLQRMVDCGVRMAMDNFGASLAPLNHLVRLPLDLVKLDAKLTALTGGGRQMAILESLIHVCKAAGLQMLAQCIETQQQLRALQELGCELGQGYFLAAPMDPVQAQYLATHNNRAAAFDD
ncbi:MAG TPA: EAL domain-containing protein [Terracidiphilus sp.]|nr:EAL domain-containing protein [Terracidiphilus sp.]